MEKIKILMVAGDMDVGGIEQQLMHLARNADPTRFQIDFTSTKANAFHRREIEALGGRFWRIPKMKPWFPLPYCRALYRLMKDEHYRVVHSHELFHSGIVLAVAALVGVEKRFVHAHNQSDLTGAGAKRSLLRRVYNRVMGGLIRRFATERIACSQPAGRFLYGRNAAFRVIPNSVNMEAFLPDSAKAREAKTMEILHAGRMTPVKNQLFLVQVAARLKDRGNKLKILCAGSGEEDYTRRVQEAIAAGQLEAHITLLGVQSDMPTLMKRARVFVLPSVYEGMPLVLLEAQAAGLPCVVADTFSHEADLGLGLVTWLPASADAADWAAALEAAVRQSRPDAAAIAEQIRARGCTPEAFAEALCRLYEVEDD